MAKNFQKWIIEHDACADARIRELEAEVKRLQEFGDDRAETAYQAGKTDGIKATLEGISLADLAAAQGVKPCQNIDDLASPNGSPIPDIEREEFDSLAARVAKLEALVGKGGEAAPDKAEEWPEVAAFDRGGYGFAIEGAGLHQLTRAQAEGYVRWIDAGIRMATGEPTGLFDALETRRILKGGVRCKFKSTNT